MVDKLVLSWIKSTNESMQPLPETTSPPVPFPCNLCVSGSSPLVRWEAVSQVHICNMQSFLSQIQTDLYLRMIWKAEGMESKTAVVFAKKYFPTQASVALCRRRHHGCFTDAGGRRSSTLHIRVAVPGKNCSHMPNLS